MTTALILGASGKIGSRLVRELDLDNAGLTVRLASHLPADIDDWRAEGRETALFDLNEPESFADALVGVDRVFLLTGYTAEMLFQSKTFVDAAADAGVSHFVHLGVFSSRRDLVPHYTWHDLIESYIAASGMAWTNLHPNNITESILLVDPPIAETGTFSVSFGDAAQGWSSAEDIAAVAAAVLREGPDEHGGKDYYMSAEVLTGVQVADILTETLGTTITCSVEGTQGLESHVPTIEDAGHKLYMQSAVIKMTRAADGTLLSEVRVQDDVQVVLGRPATTIAQWAQKNLATTPTEA